MRYQNGAAARLGRHNIGLDLASIGWVQLFFITAER